MYRRRVLAGVAALAATALADRAAPGAAQAKPVLVFAAASVKNALDAIDRQRAQQTGQRATISYAASSALARQIEAGAPADLFISADLDWMDYLQARNLIKPESRGNLLGNTLVLVAPTASPVTLAIGPGFPLAEALGDGRLAMAETSSVPAGRYGKAALEKLGVWTSVANRIAAAESVRATLLLVARGEAPLGIVYKTDAAAEPAVKIVATFPIDTHPPIIYPAALTAASANPDAPALLAYLHGPEARPVFEKEGFTVLDPGL
jgi:molybdate transport system substrate-binding protein